MPSLEEYREFYRTHNSNKKAPVPVQGQKTAILNGLRLFIGYMVSYLKNMKFDKSLSFQHYDTMLAQGITSWGYYKTKISTAEFYEFYFNEILQVKQSGYSEPYQFELNLDTVLNKLKSASPKSGALDRLTLTVDDKDYEFEPVEVATFFVCSLGKVGVFLNLKGHVTSVKQISAMFTGFHYRHKEVWFQEGNVKLAKDDHQLSNEQKMKLKEFGISAEFYQFLGMLNYPKQLKSTLRRQTGIGTDLIELIMHYRNIGQQLEGEEDKLKRAIRYKLRFWNDTQCKVIFNYIRDNANNPTNIETFCYVFLSVMSMKQPNQDHRFFFPAYLLLGNVGKLDVLDFSAQGAWKQLQILSEQGMPSSINDPQLAYTVLLAITGMHLSDQRIFSLIFGINPLTRADLKKEIFPRSGSGTTRLQLPSPRYWTKMYKGQAGTGGNEQKGVIHNIAAKTHYSGSDFIIMKDTEMSVSSYDSSPFAFLEKEQRTLSQKLRGTDLIFGSQLLHAMSSINETGVINSGYEIINRGRVICFFNSRPGSDFADCYSAVGEFQSQQQTPLPNIGGEKRKEEEKRRDEERKKRKEERKKKKEAEKPPKSPTPTSSKKSDSDEEMVDAPRYFRVT